MKNYSSRSGSTGKSSGVRGYDYDAESITIYFTNNSVYNYSIGSCGAAHVQAMKGLADDQHGLNTYVNSYKPPYAWKR